MPPIQEDEMKQNSSVETTEEQQHIVSLEDYKEHKSHNETLSNEPATMNQQEMLMMKLKISCMKILRNLLLNHNKSRHLFCKENSGLAI